MLSDNYFIVFSGICAHTTNSISPFTAFVIINKLNVV